MIDRSRIHQSPDADPWSTIVYASRGTDVRLTMVDGQVLVSDFLLQAQDVSEIAANAREAARSLAARADLH